MERQKEKREYVDFLFSFSFFRWLPSTTMGRRTSLELMWQKNLILLFGRIRSEPESEARLRRAICRFPPKSEGGKSESGENILLAAA
jgi:hypothetical protein